MWFSPLYVDGSCGLTLTDVGSMQLHVHWYVTWDSNVHVITDPLPCWLWEASCHAVSCAVERPMWQEQTAISTWKLVRNWGPQSNNPQGAEFCQQSCGLISGFFLYQTLRWDCSPGHDYHRNFQKRRWSRGPNKAMPRLLTHRNHEVINVCCFKLLYL